MNSDGHIYRAPEDEIPAEDKARLDGYLAAKAEAHRQEREMSVLAEVLRENPGLGMREARRRAGLH